MNACKGSCGQGREVCPQPAECCTEIGAEPTPFFISDRLGAWATDHFPLSLAILAVGAWALANLGYGVLL